MTTLLLKLLVNEMNTLMFCFDCRRQAQKNLFHPFQKALKVREVIEKANQPVFKDTILLKVSLTRISLRCELFSEHACATCRRAQSECEYFHNTKMVPTYLYRFMLLHANYNLNPVTLYTSRKSFIQNQSSAFPRHPSLFLTILKARATEATRSTLRYLESANSTLLHTK